MGCRTSSKHQELAVEEVSEPQVSFPVERTGSLIFHQNPIHPKVHPLLLGTLPRFQVNTKLAGRLKFFIHQWRTITNDQVILDLVTGWTIPLTQKPQETTTYSSIPSEGEELVEQEISGLIEKGAIEVTSHQPGQVLSSLFLREKKDGSHRPILNLRKLNQFIPYHHFKMENLKEVKNMIQKGDWMVKIDLKDAYFTLPLHPDSQKYVRFRWKNHIYQFLCLCFGIGPAPRLFTKLLKVPMSILRRLGIRLIIYLDDLLIFGSSREEIELARDTTLYLLENLGFVINDKRSALTPSQIMEFLGVVINSINLTMSLTDKKVLSLTKLCNQALLHREMSLRELSRLLGKLVATSAAITPCMIQVRHLQQAQILGQKNLRSYESLITLDQKSCLELTWWVENLHLKTGKPIMTQAPDLVIYSDAATSGGWGAFCQGVKTGGQWTPREKSLHGHNINMLELMAAELAIKTFTQQHTEAKNVHLMIDNKSALAYLVKMGGTKSRHLMEKAKTIWDFLLSRGIMLTAEYLPTELNVEADHESRNVADWSEWKLSARAFNLTCQWFGLPEVDLFASRTSHQLENYMSLKPDPQCIAVDALQQNWNRGFLYAFPPFNLIGRVLRKVQSQQASLILIAPLWVTQPWYPLLLELASELPILLPTHSNLLINPEGEVHPLLANKTLQLSAWVVSGQAQLTDRFQLGLEDYWSTPDHWGPEIITTQPGRNLVAGVINNKLIPFHVPS